MTKIIAEAGVNHNGSLELAIELINAAYDSGADVVKFQTFKASKLATAKAKQAEYQTKNSGKSESQLSMLSRLELSYEAHHVLVAHCESLGIEFLSTAFDSESLDFLVNDLGLKTLKVPSGDITNAPLILEHALTGSDLIVSTGMASLSEIEAALGVIAFGYTKPHNINPSIEAFQAAYYSDEGQKALKNKVTLLHCTTEYPAPMEDVNLKAMDTMFHAFGLPVGYSDHTKGINISIAAVARNAVLIEKHFTLDKNMEGPDHKASLEPVELKAMVDAIKEVDLSLGSGLKGPRPSELENKKVARKCLVANVPVSKGETFTANNLVAKRPGIGLSPYHFWRLLGAQASKNYVEGEIISD